MSRVTGPGLQLADSSGGQWLAQRGREAERFGVERATDADLTVLARVAGVDEVGRGPLAGPVTAAAVVLDPAQPILGLRDSKRLSERRRTVLAGEIRERALGWAVAHCSVAEIDASNILQASLLAMQRAVAGLPQSPWLALIDGNRAPELPCPATTIIKGDDRVRSIGAASILAKVARDELMLELELLYPGYGFAAHKGYGTALHRRKLAELGVTPEHRASFAPVRNLLQSEPAATDSEATET